MNKLTKYAVMAAHARFPKDTLIELYKHEGAIDFYRNKATDTELYTLSTPDAFYIVFRGTEAHCIKDIFTDVNAFTVPYGNHYTDIRVHQGVYRAYQSVRSWIHKKIVVELDILRPIIVIGHSLGGGLAPLCAVDIQYNYYIDPAFVNVSCYIYGALKVFNKKGVESYNKRVPNTVNIQNKRDIVTKMPPLFRYKHVGKIHKLTPHKLLQNHDIFYGYIKYLDKE